MAIPGAKARYSAIGAKSLGKCGGAEEASLSRVLLLAQTRLASRINLYPSNLLTGYEASIKAPRYKQIFGLEFCLNTPQISRPVFAFGIAHQMTATSYLELDKGGEPHDLDHGDNYSTSFILLNEPKSSDWR